MYKFVMLFIYCSLMRVTFTQAQFVFNPDHPINALKMQASALDWGDYDNDGDLDLFIADRLVKGGYLLINQAGTFETIEINSEEALSSIGTVQWVDYNQDGWLDLFFTGYGNPAGNFFYQNEGNGKLNAKDIGAFTKPMEYSQSADWGDYDNDGDLDLYIGQGEFSLAHGRNNHFFENNNSLGFIKLEGQMTVQGKYSNRQVTWIDLDGDQDLDLFIGNIKQAEVFRQDAGQSFTAITEHPFKNYFWDNQTSWTDINHDGLPDAFTVAGGPRLHIAEEEFTYTARTLDLGYQEKFEHAHDWGDFDNDGDQDLLLAIDKQVKLFAQQPDGTFNEVTLPDHDSNGIITRVLFSDHNLDGWLEILAIRSHISESCNPLYFETQPDSNHYLILKPEGTDPNSTADNAKIAVYFKQNVRYFSRQDRKGRQGDNYPLYHLGMGNHTRADSIIVWWASGKQQIVKNVSADQLITIMEPFPEKPAPPQNLTGTNLTHRELLLHWEDMSSKEAAFVLQRKADHEISFATIYTSWKNETSYQEHSLTPLTNYKYRLFARNKGSHSDTIYYNVSTLAPPPPPAAPSNLQVVKTTAYSLQLQWTDNASTEEQFILERSEENPNNFEWVATLAENLQEYHDTGLKDRTNYFYRIKAENQGSFSEYSTVTSAQTDIYFYVKKEINLDAYRTGALTYGDFDNDQQADLFWNGNLEGISPRATRVFTGIATNPDSTVSESPGTWYHTLSLWDFNRDNEVDVVAPVDNYAQSGIYVGMKAGDELMAGGKLSDLHDRLIPADLDNDGQQELIVCGNGLKILDKGLHGEWTKTQTLGSGKYHYTVVSQDYDEDNDFDLISFYKTDDGNYGGSVYLNQAGSFTEVAFTVPYRVMDAVQSDYDNDGDQDILAIAYVDNYQYQANLLAKTDTGFEPVTSFASGKTAAWSDYDLDGDQDIILPGVMTDTYFIFETRVMINQGNGLFENSLINNLLDGQNGKVAAGDFDGDGDQDLALSSDNYSYQRHLHLYKNQVTELTMAVNQPPGVPGGLISELNFNEVTLQWNPADDQETLAAGLTYNLVVRRDQEVYTVSPLSHLENGHRKVYGPGNMLHNTAYRLKCLADGQYEWSVQSVDASGAASAFAPWETFSVSGSTPTAPASITATTLSDHQIELHWEDRSENETNFLVERMNQAEEVIFRTIAVLTADIESFTDSLLQPGQEYMYQIRAFNCSAISDPGPAVDAITFLPHFSRDFSLYLPGTANQAEAGDFDNDGDLDLLLNYYQNDLNEAKIILMENQSGLFEPREIMSGFGYHSFLGWVDINRDGQLDFYTIVTESTPAEVHFYINTGGGNFEDSGDLGLKINLPITQARPVWSDFNNDGLPDLLVQGINQYNEPNNSMRIYENNPGSYFLELQSPFTGMYMDGEPCIDFNKDGLVDIVASEFRNSNYYELCIYLNLGNYLFDKIETGLPGLSHQNRSGKITWMDYNSDGYPDLVMAGQHTGSNGEGISRIYKNVNGQSLVQVNTEMHPLYRDVDVHTGDYDNDGMKDIMLYGNGRISDRQYFSQTSIYSLGATPINIPYLDHSRQYGSAVKGDFDGDGDLDMVHIGEITFDEPRILMFLNHLSDSWNRPNLPPASPGGLQETISEKSVRLSWNAPVDDLSQSLTYHVVLRSDKGDTVLTANSLQDGLRTVTDAGNAYYNTFMVVKGLKAGAYEWSVQAIDGIMQGSAFSDWQSFILEENQPNILLHSDDTEKSSIRVYPNPVGDNLYVVTDQQEAVSIRISTPEGKVVQKTSIVAGAGGQKIIDVSHLRAGFYLIALENQNIQKTLKLLKK